MMAMAITSKFESSNKPRTEDVNPLLLQWLTQWRDQAKKQGSKMEFVYGKALKTLREYPHPLRSGQECKRLKNFGDKICEKIDKQFAQHFHHGVLPSVNNRQQSSLTSTPPRAITDMFHVAARSKRLMLLSPNTPLNIKTSYTPPTKKTNRKYVPLPGTAPFAVLVALLRRHLEFDDSKVSKLDLQDMVELYTTTKPLSLIKTLNGLIKRQLVDKTLDRNSRYFLTESGRKLAISLASGSLILREFADRFIRNNHNINYLIKDSSSEIQRCQASSSQNIQTSQNFVLEAGLYEIVLCIDTRERYSNQQGSQNRTAFPVALQQKGITVEIRTLPLGDFVWIAREKVAHQSSGSYLTSNSDVQIRRELVLDYIIERKRIDDLASSIKSQRWHEQKFRLRNCGLRKPIYLIEYFGRNSKKRDYGFLSASTLDQAISNCEIDGFEVKQTDNFDETVRYLANMSRWLERFYSNKSIISCRNKKELDRTCAQDFAYITFNEFAINSSKINIFTAGEMFIKHLLQIRGLSMKKVEVIVRKYPTIRCLMLAYSSRENQKDRENLLADIKCDSIIGCEDRRLGPAISKKICQYYTSF